MTITPPMINMSKFATFQEPPTKSNNMRPGEISITTKIITTKSITTMTTSTDMRPSQISATIKATTRINNNSKYCKDDEKKCNTEVNVTDINNNQNQ